ncbi:MAG: glycosyltransferase family 2 protein [Candidatus Krumholzibacteriia bacterium]
MTVGVILPAYNAAAHVGAVVREIREREPGFRVLVVDDGSVDGTDETARATGAEVAIHAVNRGKGAALSTGFAWALAEGLEWVYTMDADGQHLPAEMDRFLERARAERLDVVVGNRMDRTGTMPWERKATNVFTSWVVGRMAGKRIPDSQNGFRLYRVEVLRGLTIAAQRYDAESEVLVKLGRRGARIGDVPVTAVYGVEKSSIRPLVDTGRFFRLVWRLRHEHH